MYGTTLRLSDDECRHRVKQWCFVGSQIGESAHARAEHLMHQARHLDLPLTEAELDAWVASL